MNIIWATRGRSWGFRFLLDGGFVDPLRTYEEAFVGAEGQSEMCLRAGGLVAVRFGDPDARTDSAGRLIPHDIVVLPPDSASVHSIADCQRKIWPPLALAFATVWQLPKAPSQEEVRRALELSAH